MSDDKQRIRTTLDEAFLFETVGPDAKESLVDMATLRHFEPGDVLVRQGDDGDCFYYIHEGMVQVKATKDGQTAVLANLGPGAVVGEIALLTGEPRTADVTAMEPTEAIHFPEEALTETLDDYPKVKELLARVLVYRAKSTIVKFARKRQSEASGGNPA